MISERPFADDDDDGSLIRPAWADSPDETDGDRGRRPRMPTRGAPGHWPAGVDLLNLLGPLCTATDALARLDARATAAPDPVREGLLARMALAEAAGWLAHVHAWVHPLDLALREAGLTASTALAALGAPHRTLPQTFAATLDHRGWADPPFEAIADGDRAVAEALALARALRRLPGKAGATSFASASAARESLQTTGAIGLDTAAFAGWWETVAPTQTVRRHRFGVRGGEGGEPPLPALLAAAGAAQSWIETANAEAPTPAQALVLAAGLFARTGATQAVFLPVWAAYPAAGFGERDSLPTLRSDAADRVLGRNTPVTWPLAFLHLVAESARAASRELDRLEAAAEKGRGLCAAADRRSRLPGAVAALLRAPVLTPKALAERLRVAPQTGTALLRALQGRGVVREVTGRGSFRAYAI